ncbi:MAG: hypothetical protein HYZ53_11865 [Planctomycetes bacterium]|nr:hypothetical protein [Planctomycetota bacterium]
MKSVKHEVIDLIRRLPDEATAADILERIYFMQQVESGMRDVEAGRVLSTTQLRRRITRWRKSTGR